ncbi:MAG: Transglycosylase protein, partial [Blastococcus sp.]|nr:Transglycosylase protein [Blastococcus sp.]
MTDRTTLDATAPDPQDSPSRNTAPADGRLTGTARRLPPTRMRRPALYLGVAAAGALLVNVLTAGEPPARAEARLESVSIAEQLGISDGAAHAVTRDDAAGSLEQLAASRS